MKQWHVLYVSLYSYAKGFVIDLVWFVYTHDGLMFLDAFMPGA